MSSERGDCARCRQRACNRAGPARPICGTWSPHGGAVRHPRAARRSNQIPGRSRWLKTRACGAAGGCHSISNSTPFLKSTRIKFHLLRAAPQREIGDDHMEQRGFAGTGLARDKRMLARAAADFEILQFRRTRAADGHAQQGGGLFRPHLPLLRERSARR